LDSSQTQLSFLDVDGLALSVSAEAVDEGLIVKMAPIIDGVSSRSGDSHQLRSDGSEIFDVRMAKFSRAILRLDAGAKLSLESGRSISIRVPQTIQPMRPGRTPHKTLADYRQALPQAWRLAWPLAWPYTEPEELRSFQAQGVSWLLSHDTGILADDMGLGKTVQAITAIRKLIADGSIKTAVVVCPRTLLVNWQQELSKWAPELWTVRMTPSSRIKEDAWRLCLGRAHVLITNYEQLREPPKILMEDTIDLVIADEAHRLRKGGSRLVTGFRRLSHKRFWALTGTPLERDAKDLATLLSVLAPRRFSDSSAELGQLSVRTQAKPYVLRRLKKDVLDELPPLVERLEHLDFTSKQLRAYKAVIVNPKFTDPASSLASINELMKICDYDPESGASSKVDRAMEIIDNVARAGEKVVVFSYLLEPLRLLKARLEEGSSKVKSQLLTGELDDSSQVGAVSKFRMDPQTVALLCSSRLAKEGLTLTEANNVIFLNEWWNPSSNAQARDRVHRISQTKPVTSFRLRITGSVEETLDRILKSKEKTFAEVVDSLSVTVWDTPDRIDVLRQVHGELRKEAAGRV
jgi:SNF2 family DNA or RNA helicase